MKYLFKRFRRLSQEADSQPAVQTEDQVALTEEKPVSPAEDTKPSDGFTEWCRSQIHGGVERRERNDFYEEYTVYGTDHTGALSCQRWHRYPEHERGFGLSYTRLLSFDEFNRRLLSELDKDRVKLADYHRCIAAAEHLSDSNVQFKPPTDLSEADQAVLREFCDSMDTLKNRTYLSKEGILSCECESVAGGVALQLRFRKPLPHDALDTAVPGVERTPTEGYDISDLWIMSVYNRLRDRSAACRVIKLSSAWSVNREELLLMCIEGFEGIAGVLLCAIGSPTDMSRFGFYSLDFSSK